MNQELIRLIGVGISGGKPPHVISAELIDNGWPETMVNDAIESWLLTNGKVAKKNTAFGEWLKKYHRKALPAVGVVVVINVISVSINLLKPWPTKILADSVFGGIPAFGPLEPYTGTTTLILITSLMTISLFAAGTLFGVVRDFILLKIGFWLNKSIKQESLRHIMHLPLFHQERLSKGDYVYRQNVVTNSLSDLVLGTTSSIIESIIVIIGVIAIMLFFNVQLTLIAVVLIPFLFVTMRLIGPKLGKVARELTELASETSSRINESVDNAETVQAFTLEDKLLLKITSLWDRGYELSKKSLLWGELLTGTNGFMIVIATSLVMYFGGSAALRGELTLGELLIFMTYMGYLLGPVENLIEQITSRNQKIIDIGRIYEVLSDHEGIEYLRSDIHMPQNITGRIEFTNVSYSYDDNVVFNNLNLLIEPGQKAAIIGPSGGGKSTILKLLPLYIEPDSGSVAIDGQDIQTVSLKELRQHISWVSQTPQLFDGTIIDNLMDGGAYREVSKEEILDAIETANVTEFAYKLPLGLASPAGENGGSLSGGQRQRVSIARALVKNAPIICLDEPTAALDAKSENLIRDSLLQMIRGKTVLMVTHRKALLALMDIVYVLENGNLTNVDQLGGLDAYLEKLEGIEEEKIVEEIKREKVTEQYSTELFQEYVETYGATNTEVNNPEISQIESLQNISNENPQEQILHIQHNSTDKIEANLDQNGPVEPFEVEIHHQNGQQILQPWTPPVAPPEQSSLRPEVEPIQMPDDSSLGNRPIEHQKYKQPEESNDITIRLH